MLCEKNKVPILIFLLWWKFWNKTFDVRGAAWTETEAANIPPAPPTHDVLPVTEVLVLWLSLSAAGFDLTPSSNQLTGLLVTSTFMQKKQDEKTRLKSKPVLGIDSYVI